MAYSELDSFVNKFKVLCQAGRNARLTLSSNAGKASVNLRLDLDVPPQQDPQLHHQTRDSNNNTGRDELLLFKLLLFKLLLVKLLLKQLRQVFL